MASKVPRLLTYPGIPVVTVQGTTTIKHLKQHVESTGGKWHMATPESLKVVRMAQSEINFGGGKRGTSTGVYVATFADRPDDTLLILAIASQCSCVRTAFNTAHQVSGAVSTTASVSSLMPLLCGEAPGAGPMHPEQRRLVAGDKDLVIKKIKRVRDVAVIAEDMLARGYKPPPAPGQLARPPQPYLTPHQRGGKIGGKASVATYEYTHTTLLP